MRFLLLLPLLFLGCATFPPVYSHEVVDGENVHLLSVDFDQYAIRPIKATPLATPLQLAKEQGAFAAINGGFFQADGTPAGLLVVDKKVVGYQNKPRAALGWTKSGDVVLLDRIIYTRNNPHFVSLTGWTTAEQWRQMDYVVGGTPLLIHEHHLIEDFDSEKVRESFLKLKHARTAVCVLDPKRWILVVVEGNHLPEFLGGRTGFTMLELAHYLANRLHCKSAINLDGGTSTALVVDGRLVSETALGERPVSDILGVFERH